MTFSVTFWIFLSQMINIKQFIKNVTCLFFGDIILKYSFHMNWHFSKLIEFYVHSWDLRNPIIRASLDIWSVGCVIFPKILYCINSPITLSYYVSAFVLPNERDLWIFCIWENIYSQRVGDSGDSCKITLLIIWHTLILYFLLLWGPAMCTCTLSQLKFSGHSI